MTVLALDLPDQVLDGLEARAASQGMTLEEYVEKVLTCFATDHPQGGNVEYYEAVEV